MEEIMRRRFKERKRKSEESECVCIRETTIRRHKTITATAKATTQYPKPTSITQQLLTRIAQLQLRQQRASLCHLLQDVKTPQQDPLGIELGVGGPVAVFL
jgi:hypothetical protein